MDSVQLTCGHCGRLMAVNAEHRGRAVRCPHCQSVVRVPASDVEPPAPAQPPPVDDAATVEFSVPFETESMSDTAATADMSAGPEPDEFGDGELPAPIIRRPRASMLVPILLIFLIPYALTTTGLVGYLFYQQKQRDKEDPLERLPDPRPGEGGARKVVRVSNEARLPAHLQTALGETLRVGELEVTPKQVRIERGKLHDKGVERPKLQLVMELDMRNVSQDQEFNPINDDFTKDHDRLKPYIYLEPRVEKVGTDRPDVTQRLYGGFLEWEVDRDGKTELVNHDHRIGPDEHMTVRLETPGRLDESRTIEWFIKSEQDLVWRIQVRRGLLPTSRGPTSATAIIGVRFNVREVQGL